MKTLTPELNHTDRTKPYIVGDVIVESDGSNDRKSKKVAKYNGLLYDIAMSKFLLAVNLRHPEASAFGRKYTVASTNYRLPKPKSHI